MVVGGGYVYGSDGYVICAANNGTDVVSLTGSYVQSVTPSGQTDYWYCTTTNTVAPIDPQTGIRNEACWYSGTTENVLVNLVNPNDGITHRMAVYCWDWNGGQSMYVNLLNPSTGLSELPGGALTLANFTTGTWVVFYFTGNVELQLTNISPYFALCQVIAFDNQCAIPAFNPVAGAYAVVQNVTISSATSGASIRYTTDGSTPSPTHGTVYASAVNISEEHHLTGHRL